MKPFRRKLIFPKCRNPFCQVCNQGLQDQRLYKPDKELNAVLRSLDSAIKGPHAQHNARC